MSTVSQHPIDYGKPRTIWTIVLQLFYTSIAMLPFYYYLREIVEIPAEGRYLLQFLPMMVAILLFFMQLQFNVYFWRREKTYVERDIYTTALKSVLVTISMFYLIFFLIFGYWFGIEDTKEALSVNEPITALFVTLSVTLLTIALGMVFVIAIQNDRRTGRSFRDRIGR